MYTFPIYKFTVENENREKESELKKRDENLLFANENV